MGIQQKPRWELAIAMSPSDINGSCWTSRDYQLSHNVWHQMPMEPQINNDVIFFYSHCWQKDCFVWVVYQCDFEVRSKVPSLILCLQQMTCVGLESCMPTSMNPVCQSFVGLCSPVCVPCVLVCTWLLTGVCFPSSLCPTESALSASTDSQPPAPLLSWHSELRRHNTLLWWCGSWMLVSRVFHPISNIKLCTLHHMPHVFERVLDISGDSENGHCYFFEGTVVHVRKYRHNHIYWA